VRGYRWGDENCLFSEGFLRPFLFLYKLGAILNFPIIITCDVIGIKTE
jgi:hypothetical protein